MTTFGPEGGERRKRTNANGSNCDTTFMPAKSTIIGELGEQPLLLPERIEEALFANDRLKFYLTLLQAAEGHADSPAAAIPDFAAECRAAHIAENGIDRTVRDARRDKDGALYVPGAEHIRQNIVEELARMRAPLALAHVPENDGFGRREAALTAALPAFAEGRVPAGAIGTVTSADSGRGDSVHLLVMDMHKALNALQGDLAEETIDGARVWRIRDEDRPLVRAFMAGLNETAPLKFDHPGLGTTATRAGGLLVIQNDIGTTGAHVLVVHVEGDTATLIYTDIHAARTEFFQSLFQPFNVQWEDTRARHADNLDIEQNYYLCVGRFTAAGDLTLERYLAFLGSRIVFLIDWNRARKRLREFLRKEDAPRLLKWAATNNIGHRGFLKLGGERLIYEAIEFVPESPLHYGEKLYEALGAAQALDFMKFTLRAATEGLLQGRSERFIRDEVKTELARHFLSIEGNLLSIAARHAERIFDLAAGLRDALLRHRGRASPELLGRTAQQARQWELSLIHI